MVSTFLRRSNSLSSNDSRKRSNSNTSNDSVAITNHEEIHPYRQESNAVQSPDPEEDDFFDNDVLLPEPLSPPKELHPGRLYALYEFSGPDPSQCDLEYDDAVILLNDDDSYWWLIKKVKDSNIGFAPAECLETPGERLARLNCWKNEELERISKEEGKKKSKSLLSLTRKASKLANSSTRRSGKSVMFNEEIDYSETVYITDSEDSEDDYDTEEEEDDEIAEGKNHISEALSDNDTLEGDDRMDDDDDDDIDVDDDDDDNNRIIVDDVDSDDDVSQLVVHKQRSKRLSDDSRSFDNELKTPVTIKRAPTPPASKHQQFRQNLHEVEQLEAEVLHSSRASSIYEESASFRKSQDMEAVLLQAQIEDKAATTPIGMAAPTTAAAASAPRKSGSVATMSSSYSIGDYSPSSSEFESDNQTPTKFQVLNSLQLSSSTINGALILEKSEKEELMGKQLGSPVNLFTEESSPVHRSSITTLTENGSTIDEIDKQLKELESMNGNSGVNEAINNNTHMKDIDNGLKPVKEKKLVLSPSKSLKKQVRETPKLEFKSDEDLNETSSTIEALNIKSSGIMGNKHNGNSDSTTTTSTSKFSPEDDDAIYDDLDDHGDNNSTPNSSYFTGSSSSLIVDSPKHKSTSNNILQTKINSSTSNMMTSFNGSSNLESDPLKPKSGTGTIVGGTIFANLSNSSTPTNVKFDDKNLMKNSNFSTPNAIGSKRIEFSIDANKSFSSLLDDYHPEVNEMFYPLFDRADSLTTKIEDLKKLLVG